MGWALTASIALNTGLIGFMAGFITLHHLSNGGGEAPAGDVPGGGVAQDPDEDCELDTTVIGFKANGDKQ